MFGLTQYNGNGALMATTGFMLTPLASALNRVGYSVSRDEEMPSIVPAQPSSEWSEWLTSGYVGEFLGWAGQQLVEVGQDLFPEFSIPERQRQMEMSKEELKRLLAESLLEEDEENDIKIREVLGIYLRQGVALINRGALELEVWKEDLMALQSLAARTRQGEVLRVFKESMEQVDLLLLRQKEDRGHDLNLNYETTRDGSQNTRVNLAGSTIDLATLNSTQAGFTINGVNSRDNLGISVSSAGDVNGDGIADVIIGADYSSGITHPGKSYVVFGSKAAGLAGSTIDLGMLSSTQMGFTINGESSERAGYSVSGAGDVNGDGVADVIIGTRYADGDDYRSGKSYVVFGSKATSLGGSIIDLAVLNSTKAGFTINGAHIYDYSGSSVSGAGDVNGDGVADIVIGAWYANGDSVHSGQSYVVFGSKAASLAGSTIDLATLNSTKAGFTINGAGPGDQSGYSVSSAGDVNGDGIADIIIGALYATGDASHSGRSYVVFGSQSASLAGSTIHLATLSSTKAGFTIKGANGGDRSGCSVSGAGDVNNDGVADVIIGAFYATGDALHSGQSYVVFGSKAADFAGGTINLATLSRTQAGFTINGINNDDLSGYSVSGAGDVNGDGIADIIIGAKYATGDVAKSGQSYVVFGSEATDLAGSIIDLATLNSTQAGFTINGANTFDRAGYSVSDAGDVNGDGVADIIIGAWYANGDSIHSGQSYVVFGIKTTEDVNIGLDFSVSTAIDFKNNDKQAEVLSHDSDYARKGNWGSFWQNPQASKEDTKLSEDIVQSRESQRIARRSRR